MHAAAGSDALGSCSGVVVWALWFLSTATMSALAFLLHDYVVVPRAGHEAPHCPHGVEFVVTTLDAHPHELGLGPAAGVSAGAGGGDAGSGSGVTVTGGKHARKAAARLSKWITAVEAFVKHKAPSAKEQGAALLLATLRHADAGTFVAHAAALTLLTRLLVKPSAPVRARAIGAKCLAQLLAGGCTSAPHARASVLACVDKGLVVSIIGTMTGVAQDAAGAWGTDPAAVAASAACCACLEVAVQVAPTLMRAHAGRVERASLSILDHPSRELAAQVCRLLAAVPHVLGDSTRVSSSLAACVASLRGLVTLAMPQLLAGRGAGGFGAGDSDSMASASVLQLPQLECDEAAVSRRFARLVDLVAALLDPGVPSTALVTVPTTALLELIEVVVDSPFLTASRGSVRALPHAHTPPSRARGITTHT